MDKELKIETEIAKFAIKQFVEKLREWCNKPKTNHFYRDGKYIQHTQGTYYTANALLEVAESLSLQTTKEVSAGEVIEEMEKGLSHYYSINMNASFKNGYSQAVDDIKQFVNKGKE
jgi:hypothetical protein